jgi:hypothetical protein
MKIKIRLDAIDSLRYLIVPDKKDIDGDESLGEIQLDSMNSDEENKTIIEAIASCLRGLRK